MQYQSLDFGSDGGGGGSSTSNSQYIQEMIQYSTIQAMQALQGVTNYTLAAGLTGKNVSYTQVDIGADGKTYTTETVGTVNAVDFTGEIPRCYVSTTGADGTVTSNWINYSDINMVYSSDVTIGSASSPTAGQGT